MENSFEMELAKKIDNLMVLSKSLAGKLAFSDIGNDAELLLSETKEIQSIIKKTIEEEGCLWQFQLTSGEWVVYPKKMNAVDAGKLWHKKLDLVRGKRVKCIVPDNSRTITLK